MTTVWAVHFNYYEDSTTVAVFSTQKLAQDHADELNGPTDGYHEVLAYEILDQPPRKVLWHQAHAYLLPGGEIVRHEGRLHAEEWNYIRDDPEVTVHKAYGDKLGINVYSTDPAAAAALREKTIQHIQAEQAP